MPRGTETLLVVDDEPSVRRFLQQYLERQGYRVLVAEDGERALECLESEQPLDLLISDVMMPGLKGDELAARAIELRQDLSVLLISGHADLSVSRQTADYAFLSKPFTTQELGQQVRQLLDEEKADA
jgi:DNA-binding NtrC family response regulator